MVKPSLLQDLLHRRARTAWYNMTNWFAGSNVPTNPFAASLDNSTHISFFDLLDRRPVVHEWAKRFSEPEKVWKQIQQQGDYTPLVWAHIPSRTFWNAAAPFVSIYCNLLWPKLLDIASENGNVCIFECCPQDTLVTFLYNPSGEWHPDVWAWLINENYTTAQKRQESIVFDMPTIGNIFHLYMERFVNKDFRWRLDKLLKIYRDYGLTQEKKVKLTAQNMRTLKENEWLILVEQCKCYIEDIDLESLRIIFTNQDFKSSALNDYLSMVTEYRNYKALDISFPCLHAGMSMLLELNPPKNQYDLYCLAQKARLFDTSLERARQVPLELNLLNMLE